MSIENMFANMTYGTSNGFSNQILGQANYINQLQNGGMPQNPGLLLNQTMGQINGFGPAANPFAQAVGQLANPSQLQRGQMQQLLGALKRFLQQQPQMFGGLSGPSKQLVRGLVRQAPSHCCCGPQKR